MLSTLTLSALPLRMFGMLAFTAVGLALLIAVVGLAYAAGRVDGRLARRAIVGGAAMLGLYGIFLTRVTP